MLHTTTTFGINGAKALKAELTRGIAPVLVQGYQSGDGFSGVILAVRQFGFDLLINYFSLDTDPAIFARQLGELGVNITWLGSAAIKGTTARKLAGSSLHGTYGVADYAADANPASKALSGYDEFIFLPVQSKMRAARSLRRSARRCWRARLYRSRGRL